MYLIHTYLGHWWIASKKQLDRISGSGRTNPDWFNFDPSWKRFKSIRLVILTRPKAMAGTRRGNLKLTGVRSQPPGELQCILFTRRSAFCGTCFEDMHIKIQGVQNYGGRLKGLYLQVKHQVEALFSSEWAFFFSLDTESNLTLYLKYYSIIG